MIQIYDKNGNLIIEGDTSASASMPNGRRNCMVYIFYQQGSEDSITISFAVKEATAREYFPIQQDDGSSIVDYKRTLSGGKYRIFIPMAENEEELQVSISMNGDTSSPGIVKVWIIPTYMQF